MPAFRDTLAAGLFPVHVLGNEMSSTVNVLGR